MFANSATLYIHVHMVEENYKTVQSPIIYRENLSGLNEYKRLIVDA